MIARVVNVRYTVFALAFVEVPDMIANRSQISTTSEIRSSDASGVATKPR